MGERRQSIAVLMAVFVILIILRVVVAQNPITTFTNRVLSPFGSLGRILSFESPKSKESQNSSNEQLLEENRELRQQLNLPDQPKFVLVKADVLGKSLQTYRQTIRINAGKDSGIETGMPALYRGDLVGLVDVVEAKSSTIRLIGDPDFRAAVYVAGTEVQGIIRTEAGGLILDNANRTNDSLDEKSVFTSGLGGVFPPGIFIGKLGTELSESTDVFSSFVIRRVVNYSSLNFVEIITDVN